MTDKYADIRERLSNAKDWHDQMYIEDVRRLLDEVELLKAQGIKAVDEIISHKYELMRKDVEIERLRKALAEIVAIKPSKPETPMNLGCDLGSAIGIARKALEGGVE